MTSINLTWDEAKARAALIEVSHYDVRLDFTDGTGKPGTDVFRSTTVVDFTSRTAGASVMLDLRARHIEKVILNGRDITSTVVAADGSYDPTDGITLPDLVEGPNQATVVATCAYSTNGEGLHRYVNAADGEVYLYTQFETADAKRVFACFDQPDLKATYSFEVITPAQWVLVTNGTVDTVVADGVATHTSRVDYKLSTYLVAFIAGPYVEVRDEWRGTIAAHPETPDTQELVIPLGLYCRKDLAEFMDSERLFAETKQGFDFYAKRFGVPYPFGKYDQIFCPEYNFGAMENAGAVTIREDYIFRGATPESLYERRNETILHEMAHMWFGDLVTMEWWNDLWLNESFATWASVQAQNEVSDYTGAWVTFANSEKAWAYQQDQQTSTHPITTDASTLEIVQQNFDGITYAKGASTLKQLAAYVGLEEFFAGVRLHFVRHAFGNATFDDLLSALEDASGRDLSGWAGQWLKTTGVNTLSAEFEVGADGTYTSFAIRQSPAAPGAGELRTHRIGVGVYADNGAGSVVKTAGVELDIEGELTPVDALVGVKAGDFVLPNDGDLSYALVAFDPASQAFVVDNIDRIEDQLARALVWSACWEQVRAGQMRARDFIALVGRGLPAEDHPSVVKQLVLQLVGAGHAFADPEWMAQAGWGLITDILFTLARTAAGDTQLHAVKALASVPPTEDTVALARAIIDEVPGHVGVEGLSVDTDMKWLAIKLLASASAGVAPGTVAVPHAETVDGVENLIARGERRDQSSLGAQAATEARALIPLAANKAALWEEIFGRSGQELSNRIQLAKVQGFVTPGRLDLAEQYSRRYFEDALQGWTAAGGAEVAIRLMSAMYPTWDVSEQAQQWAAQALADPATPAGLARVITEGLDTVKRRAHARAVDRGDAR